MKRIIAVLLSVLLLLTGCAAEPMTAKEYHETTYPAYQEFIKQSWIFTDYAVRCYENGESISDSDIDAWMKNLNHCLDVLEVCVPPEEYSEQYKALCKTIRIKRKWVELGAEYLRRNADYDEVFEPVTEGVPQIYLFDLLIKMQENGDIEDIIPENMQE